MDIAASPVLKAFGVVDMSILDAVAKLDVSSPDDQAAMDMQLRLMAFYAVTFGRLRDEMPMACRLVLVTEVIELMENQKLHKAMKQRSPDIFAAMKDTDLQQKREEMAAKVSGLNKAFDVLEKLQLV
ncbi:MAG: hypothetical protein LQ349_009915 [Xanthoria aureola]|nr:MAG: hypothetical protein LQ349_009915 [Xanthoria aureola]